MSKKLLAGILLGGAATYAAWKKMAPAKKEALKESVDEKINKVADYAAAGVPVINTQNSEEYRQLLEKYNAGINVENGNILAFADAIKTLYEDESLRQAMCKNAKTMFDELFDRQKSYPKLINEIENLLIK